MECLAGGVDHAAPLLDADVVATRLKPIAADLMVVSLSDCGQFLAELAERQTNGAALIVENQRARLNLTWEELIVPAEVQSEVSQAA